MAFKFIAFFAFVAVAKAGVIGYDSHPAYSSAPSVSYSSVSAPVASHVSSPVHAKAAAPVYAAPAYKVAAPLAYAAPVVKKVVAEEYAPAHYQFGYEVNDLHTGDVKNHQESREGDLVKGSYSFIEADGSRRIVEYTVDPHSGFNAVVHKEAGAVPVKAVAPVYAKVAAPAYAKVVAPLVAKVAAPVAYAAPHNYAAPAFAKVAYPAVPAVAKVGYSAAPAVSYSSVSAPLDHAAPSYYH
ncbi:uncharacterized protein [Leptinotarsa decemlineata]|uniref:uncharacterized protein n=1 Tax=Leptinotarsa decemlineata TaxID=7539 RepID=UPI003D3071EB